MIGTSKLPDTIAVDIPMVKGEYTMKGTDEVVTMKTLQAKRHALWMITNVLGYSDYTVRRDIENGFDAAPHKQPPSAFDAHGDFLLERFMRLMSGDTKMDRVQRAILVRWDGVKGLEGVARRMFLRRRSVVSGNFGSAH